jgi:hypothetical protein
MKFVKEACHLAWIDQIEAIFFEHGRPRTNVAIRFDDIIFFSQLAAGLYPAPISRQGVPDAKVFDAIFFFYLLDQGAETVGEFFPFISKPQRRSPRF